MALSDSPNVLMGALLKLIWQKNKLRMAEAAINSLTKQM
jgi:hypothetical protein